MTPESRIRLSAFRSVRRMPETHCERGKSQADQTGNRAAGPLLRCSEKSSGCRQGIHESRGRAGPPGSPQTRTKTACAGIHRQAHEEKGKMPRTLDSCPNRRKPPSASSFRPKAGRYRETGTPERSCWKNSARNDFSFRVLFFDQNDDRVQSHAQIVKSRPFTTIRKSPSRPRTGCSRLYIHPSTFSISIIDGMDSVPHNSFLVGPFLNFICALAPRIFLTILHRRANGMKGASPCIWNIWLLFSGSLSCLS